MSPNSPPTRYPVPIIALHWLTLVLIVLAYSAMEFRDLFERGSAGRELMKATHYSLGLSILALTLVRLVLRATMGPAPAISPPPPRLQVLAARLIHVALYAFLIVMPVLGWLTLSTEGDPIAFWGIPVPALMGPDKVLSGRFEVIHETLALVGYALIGLHAAAAVVHHHMLKDNTLQRITRR